MPPVIDRGKVEGPFMAMFRMIREYCHNREACEAKLSCGVNGVGVGVLTLQLPDHFDEELEAIKRTIHAYLGAIATALGFDRDRVTIEIDPGPPGTPAPPGSCDKVRDDDPRDDLEPWLRIPQPVIELTDTETKITIARVPPLPSR